MYPDEYDIYDQATEGAMKKNYAGKKAKPDFGSTQQDGPGGKSNQAAPMNWKVPNFSNETEILDRFYDQDKENLRGLQRYQQMQRREERELDRFLERQALDYYKYQKERPKNRKEGKSNKTLRTVLAENYQAFVYKFKERAEKRFPHTSYGQDKNSETFKKSFPSSYKRHFFKLVKNILVAGKGANPKINRKGCNLLMANGARQSTL